MNTTFRMAANGELEPQIAKCRETFEAIPRKMTQPAGEQTLDEAERGLSTFRPLTT